MFTKKNTCPHLKIIVHIKKMFDHIRQTEKKIQITNILLILTDIL